MPRARRDSAAARRAVVRRGRNAGRVRGPSSSTASSHTVKRTTPKGPCTQPPLFGRRVDVRAPNGSWQGHAGTAHALLRFRRPSLGRAPLLQVLAPVPFRRQRAMHRSASMLARQETQGPHRLQPVRPPAPTWVDRASLRHARYRRLKSSACASIKRELSIPEIQRRHRSACAYCKHIKLRLMKCTAMSPTTGIQPLSSAVLRHSP